MHVVAPNVAVVLTDVDMKYFQDVVYALRNGEGQQLWVYFTTLLGVLGPHLCKYASVILVPHIDGAVTLAGLIQGWLCAN